MRYTQIESLIGFHHEIQANPIPGNTGVGVDVDQVIDPFREPFVEGELKKAYNKAIEKLLSTVQEEQYKKILTKLHNQLQEKHVKRAAQKEKDFFQYSSGELAFTLAMVISAIASSGNVDLVLPSEIDRANPKELFRLMLETARKTTYFFITARPVEAAALIDQHVRQLARLALAQEWQEAGREAEIGSEAFKETVEKKAQEALGHIGFSAEEKAKILAELERVKAERASLRELKEAGEELTPKQTECLSHDEPKLTFIGTNGACISVAQGHKGDVMDIVNRALSLEHSFAIDDKQRYAEQFQAATTRVSAFQFIGAAVLANETAKAFVNDPKNTALKNALLLSMQAATHQFASREHVIPRDTEAGSGAAVALALFKELGVDPAEALTTAVTECFGLDPYQERKDEYESKDDHEEEDDKETLFEVRRAVVPDVFTPPSLGRQTSVRVEGEDTLETGTEFTA